MAQLLYSRLNKNTPPEPPTNPISVVCISDTHNYQIPLPDGDVLIHAGDITQSGTYDELQAALSWLAAQPHPIKVVVAGNHDTLLDETRDTPDTARTRSRQRRLLLEDHNDLLYLQDSGVTVTAPNNSRRLRIHGSPQSPRHGSGAFQYPGSQNVWRESLAAGEIDILITHGPPRAHLDLGNGCVHLLQQLWRLRPRLHVCGHIHAGAGMTCLAFDHLQHTYEQVIIRNNLRSLLSFFVACIGAIIGWTRRVEVGTILVNAAVVGGLRDTVRRGAVRVVI